MALPLCGSEAQTAGIEGLPRNNEDMLVLSRVHGFRSLSLVR